MAAKMLAVFGMCVLIGGCGGDSAAPTTPAARPPITDQALRGEVEKWRAAAALPGLAAVVVSGDDIVAVNTGQRRIGDPAPLVAGDRFQTGSLTKSMTATLLARLVEQKKLRWDARLGDIFPAWRSGMVHELAGVTVEQLLRHRAGFKHDLEDADAAALMPHATGNLTADRALVGAYFLQQRPLHAPNTRYEYSNIGYLIAGLVAEAAGADSFEHLMDAQVFKPLTMAAMIGLPEDAAPGTIAGHTFASGAWQVAQYSDVTRMWLRMIHPAGGASVSTDDYGRYLREHLRGLRGTSSYLTAASVKTLHTPVEGYALGWGVEDHAATGRISVHAGSVGTYYGMTIVMPERNRAVAVFCNCYSESAAAHIGQLVKVLATQP